MTTQRQLNAILNELRPQLQAALLASFASMQDGVDYPALELAIDQFDIAGVEEALNIDDGSFAPYILAALTIYLRFGKAFAPTLGVSFTPNMPQIQDDIAVATTRMVEEARLGVNQVVRRGWASGMSKREIVKQIRPIVALSRPQMFYVENMRERLLSGDPAQMRAVLTGQTLRDKRYDPLIKRAIKVAKAGGGNILTQAKVDEISEKYAARLLRRRAIDIAQAEADQYAEEAKFEAAKKVPGGVEREWRHSRIYLNARRDHVGMSGEKRRGDDVFIMANGAAMRYAHDPRGGAVNNASCRCRTIYRRLENV